MLKQNNESNFTSKREQNKTREFHDTLCEILEEHHDLAERLTLIDFECAMQETLENRFGMLNDFETEAFGNIIYGFWMAKN